MLEAYSRAWTEIDYDAIRHNVKEVKKLVKNTKIMGIVKANAYGLGDVACAKALQKCGVDYFGVSSIDEALNLRNAGIQDNILILGYTPSMHFHYLHEQNIVQSLVSIEYARELNAYAKENDVDILICDTAGRLQNKTNLMNELSKMHRVVQREIEGAPQEVWLVLDATTGQNGISQAKVFLEATDVTGIVLTKMDGTAKGGVVLAIRDLLHLPVRFLGLGEKPADLRPFDINAFLMGITKGIEE